MLPQPEIESLERQSLENEFRRLDVVHERVKGWADDVSRDVELQNVQTLKKALWSGMFRTSHGGMPPEKEKL